MRKTALFCSLLACILPFGQKTFAQDTTKTEDAAKTPEPLPDSLLPYLQNPTADGMTVCLLTQKGTGDVRVVWRTVGGTEKPRTLVVLAMKLILV